MYDGVATYTILQYTYKVLVSVQETSTSSFVPLRIDLIQYFYVFRLACAVSMLY